MNTSNDIEHQYECLENDNLINDIREELKQCCCTTFVVILFMFVCISLTLLLEFMFS